MARWGEGDPRWIVEERPDATNVNNWHWTEKDAAQWSKDKLKTLLLNVQIDDSNIGKCSISEVTAIEGEAVANNRKGKLIFFYEWLIKCNWIGYVNGKDVKYTGKLEIPNLSEENCADEITTDVSVDSTDNEAEILKELMRKQGLKKVQDVVEKYIKALRDEFARDMIKPTKSANGDDASINSFKTDEQLKKKAQQNAKEIKRPTHVPAEVSSDVGIKIDTTELEFNEHFKCTAEELYRVLTDQNMIQAFTGNKAIVNSSVGGKFELLDGNIQGKFLELVNPNLIKKEWRIRNWPAEHYSIVSINIKQMEDTTQVLIKQTGVPCLELDRTKEGWRRYYFESIKRTFGFGASMF